MMAAGLDLAILHFYILWCIDISLLYHLRSSHFLCRTFTLFDYQFHAQNCKPGSERYRTEITQLPLKRSV